MPNYYILNDLPNDHGLPKVPTQLWLLLTLEVVVRDAHGESLLLTYPSYSLEGTEDAGPIAEGYWTPPFFGFPVDLGFGAPDTVGAVRKRFKKHEDAAIDAPKSIGQLAYLMGLPNPEIVNVGYFIELKKSPRSPEIWKCYKVLRFACTKLGPRGRRNLADPECRKGYVFLPLNELDEVLSTNYSKKHGRPERRFLAKPLISNLDYVLQSSACIASLRANAIELDSKHFRHEEEGLVLCADLAGYGTACKYAVEHMHTFTEKGTGIAMYFRESIACLFYQFLAGISASQVHTAGDGFIAAIPKRHFIEGDVCAAVRTFLNAYREMLCEVEKFNEAITDAKKKIGSRLALHYGKYRYGRIALSRSTSADFDGDSIIEVARLEGALREYTKGPIQKNKEKKGKGAGKKEALSRSHTLIYSQNLQETAKDEIDCCKGLTLVAELPIRIKEFESNARVYKIDLTNKADGGVKEAG